MLLPIQPHSQPRHEPTPADYAADLRLRADHAVDETTRAYWLWLADEWDKTADRDRRWPPLRAWRDE